MAAEIVEQHKQLLERFWKALTRGDREGLAAAGTSGGAPPNCYSKRSDNPEALALSVITKPGSTLKKRTPQLGYSTLRMPGRRIRAALAAT